MDVATLKRQLDEDERFLDEIRDRLSRQMRKLKAEESELRKLLLHNASAVVATTVAEHSQNVTDLHVDEEQWINQIPLDLNGSVHNQRSFHHSVVKSENKGGVQPSAVLPAELHEQEAARTVIQSILEEELGSDWKMAEARTDVPGS